MRQCSLCFGGLVTLMSQSQKECLAQDFKKIFLGVGGNAVCILFIKRSFLCFCLAQLSGFDHLHLGTLSIFIPRCLYASVIYSYVVFPNSFGDIFNIWTFLLL